MKDDFLAQIQAAEQQAEEILENAEKRLKNELSEYTKDLEKDRGRDLQKERARQQEKLAQKNVEGREKYNELVEEAKKGIQVVRKEAENKQEKTMLSVEAYFLNELLS